MFVDWAMAMSFLGVTIAVVIEFGTLAPVQRLKYRSALIVSLILTWLGVVVQMSGYSVYLVFGVFIFAIVIAASGYYKRRYKRKGKNMLIDYQGRKVEAVSIDWKTNKEEWNEYEFDGHKVKVKIVLIRVLKLVDEKNPDGSPIYLYQTSNVFGPQETIDETQSQSLDSNHVKS